MGAEAESEGAPWQPEGREDSELLCFPSQNSCPGVTRLMQGCGGGGGSAKHRKTDLKQEVRPEGRADVRGTHPNEMCNGGAWPQNWKPRSGPGVPGEAHGLSTEGGPLIWCSAPGSPGGKRSRESERVQRLPVLCGVGTCSGFLRAPLRSHAELGVCCDHLGEPSVAFPS